LTPDGVCEMLGALAVMLIRHTHSSRRRSQFACGVGFAALLPVLIPAVASANTASVCNPVNASVNSGATITIRPSCTDADGDGLYPLLAAGTAVAHGQLSQTPAGDGWTYTPAQGYGGPDGF
jgi:Big-like domain-containing protein